jgi:hypothetical protein
MNNAEAVAREVFRSVGASPDAPPSGGAIELALAFVGTDGIYVQPRALQEACIAVIHGKRRIVVRAGLHHRRAHFAVAAMLARLVGAHPNVEAAAAAWIVAPPQAFSRALSRLGVNLPGLASTFSVTETCAALRTIEVTERDGAVTTPERVYKRGSIAWVRDEDVRSLASARRTLRSCKPHPIKDEPGRMALLKTA